MGGRRRAIATSAIALALALPVALACEQALSIDGPVTVTPHDACGLPVNPGSCQSCVANECCSQASACAADHQCNGYESCTLACGTDYECRVGCALASGKAGPSIWTLDQCIAAHCSDACQEVCGLPAVPTAPDAAAACASCMGTRACSEVQACTRDLACEDLSHCLAGCSTLDCHQGCIATRDAGTFTALEVALVASCQKPCELGQLWICLGNEPNPTLPPGQADVTISLSDATSGKPLDGLQVTACTASDSSCSQPVASGMTDPHGNATLMLPPTATLGLGFRGYFQFVQPGDASLESPQLFFFSQNFSVEHAWVTWFGFSQAALDTQASAVGMKVDPTQGHLLLQAFDCLQAPASDVSFEVTASDGTSVPVLYWVGGGITSGLTATSIVGLGVALNVPPGELQVVATPVNVGRPSTKVTVFARPGWLTSVALAPNQ